MRRSYATAFGVCLVLAGVRSAEAGSITFSAAGANAAAIQSTVDAFRSALGPLNPNLAGSANGGRREINWDGVPDGFSAPNNLPANFFNANSPRGVVFSTPGTGFQVSATAASGTPVEFGNINAGLPPKFAPFSPQRLFTALGSTITDVNFFVPGSSAPAYTTAFGAVFTDVDFPGSTSLQFFDLSNNSIGTFLVPPTNGEETLSFLGVMFTGGERVGRVRITSGNLVLGDLQNQGDVVVMDDFIYAEPTPVPEPATGVLVLAGLGIAGAVRFRRRR